MNKIAILLTVTMLALGSQSVAQGSAPDTVHGIPYKLIETDKPNRVVNNANKLNRDISHKTKIFIQGDNLDKEIRVRHIALDGIEDPMLTQRLEKLEKQCAMEGIGAELISLRSDSLTNWLDSLQGDFLINKISNLKILKEKDLNKIDELDIYVQRLLVEKGITLDESLKLIVLEFASSDSTLAYSKTVSGPDMVLNAQAEEQLPSGQSIVYPNPASNKINIVLDDLDNGPVSVQVVSLKGKELLKRQLLPLEGNINTQIELPMTKSGMYLLNFKQGDREWQERLIIR